MASFIKFLREPVVVLDTTGVIVGISPPAAAFFNVTDGVGKTWREVASPFLINDDHKIFDPASYLEGDEDRDGAIVFMIASGFRAVHFHIIALDDFPPGGGHAIYLDGIDVGDTALREGEEQEERIAGETWTERAEAFKNKVISVISHDLRSPYTADLGLLGMLLDSEDNPPTYWQRSIIDTVLRSFSRQFTLIENLLELSRIYRGTLTVNPDRVTAMSLVEDALLTLTPQAKEKGIALSNRGDGTETVEVDVRRVAKALKNIVDNAIKYTEPGGRVDIMVERIGEDVAIDITDTGVGIEPDRLAQIFDLNRAQKTLGAAGEGGAGIGLVMARELVAVNGGRLEIGSAPEMGTTVKLKFRKKKDDDLPSRG